ncbi:hypothetical protein DFH06DRAFT_1250992 [Mycena polygramma]|nr:hypothetical protein DFH06DRAFT_1250992 [Mycena polygramma]
MPFSKHLHFPHFGNNTSTNTSTPKTEPPPSYSDLPDKAIPQADPDPLRCLVEYDTIVIVDDSDSMRTYSSVNGSRLPRPGDVDPIPTRWEQAQRLVNDLVPCVAHYDKNGVEVRFFNNPKVVPNCRGPYTVSSALAFTPNGDTPLGTTLWNHLKPYLDVVQKENLPKPRNYIVVTDANMAPPREKELVTSTILHTAQILRERGCAEFQCRSCSETHRWLGVQFIQVGDDKKATKFLDELDTIAATTLRGVDHKNFVDTKCLAVPGSTTLNAILCGGIMDKFDSDESSKQAQPDSAAIFRPDPFPASAVAQRGVYHPSNILTTTELSAHDLYQKQQLHLGEVWAYWQQWHSCMHRQQTHVDSASKKRYVGGFAMDEPPLVEGCWTRQPDRSWQRNNDCLGPPPVSDMFEIMLKDKEWCNERHPSGM